MYRLNSWPSRLLCEDLGDDLANTSLFLLVKDAKTEARGAKGVSEEVEAKRRRREVDDGRPKELNFVSPQSWFQLLLARGGRRRVGSVCFEDFRNSSKEFAAGLWTSSKPSRQRPDVMLGSLAAS